VKLPSGVVALARRFDRLSLRERLLVMAATLVVIVGLFNVLVLRQLDARKQSLSEQLTEIVSQINDSAVALSTGGGSDSTTGVLERTRALTVRLARATASLRSGAAGLVPPERMTQVIHDVLSRQRGLTLISLRSLPPYSLTGRPSGGSDTAGSTAADSTANPVPGAEASASSVQGPYVHSVELVIQGRYLDVLAYLQALEGLQWHFYWQSLELDATHYPVSRVTVKLGTVSMSPEWIRL
jgi:MSHA biogenesis protein MshJ